MAELYPTPVQRAPLGPIVREMVTARSRSTGSCVDHIMKTTICVKMDAPKPLLLLCHQLDIVTYHPDVLATSANGATGCRVPTLRVKLVHSMRLPLRLEECSGGGEVGLPQAVVLYCWKQTLGSRDVQIPDALVSSTDDGATTNCLGWVQRLNAGTEVGSLQAIEVVELAEGELSSGSGVGPREVKQ